MVDILIGMRHFAQLIQVPRTISPRLVPECSTIPFMSFSTWLSVEIGRVPPDQETAFPQSMYIDYVRVYQRKTGK
jgi:hypothetical protein